eukprot:3865741-Pyramimonas_sp.AAC.1
MGDDVDADGDGGGRRMGRRNELGTRGAVSSKGGPNTTGWENIGNTHQQQPTRTDITNAHQ